MVYASARELSVKAIVSASRSKSAAWRWAAAIVVSLSANSLFVGLYWSGLRLAPVRDSAPAVLIQLVPSLSLPRNRLETPKHAAARSASLAPRPAPPAVPSAPFVPAPPTVVPTPGEAGLASLSRALRGRLGCNLPHLTDAERAHCITRWAANRPTIPTPIMFDPHGRYAGDPEPYLTRMPKNGCKVRAAGDTAFPGMSGVAAGVSCGWSF